LPAQIPICQLTNAYLPNSWGLAEDWGKSGHAMDKYYKEHLMCAHPELGPNIWIAQCYNLQRGNCKRGDGKGWGHGGNHRLVIQDMWDNGWLLGQLYGCLYDGYFVCDV